MPRLMDGMKEWFKSWRIC